MKKWAVIISTYGHSKFRLTKTIESIVNGTKIPYDLWVRGASEDYWQQCEQREVANNFGVNFMESARWRHWELANSVKTVKNPMIAFVKDDIIFPEGWLEAIDYFWENNPIIPIGSVGTVFLEAWELVNAGILESEDEMWSKKITIQRWQYDEIAQAKNIKYTHGVGYKHPFPCIGTCPFAYTIKREDFHNWNGSYYAGPGDTTVIYAYLALLHGKLSFYLPYPTVLHRKAQSSFEYWKYHKVQDTDAWPLIWYSKELGEDFKSRWQMTWDEFKIISGKKLQEEVTKQNLLNLKFLMKNGNKGI